MSKRLFIVKQQATFSRVLWVDAYDEEDAIALGNAGEHSGVKQYWEMEELLEDNTVAEEYVDHVPGQPQCSRVSAIEGEFE